MKFVFRDKKVDLSERVHEYAEKKVGKLDRYFKSGAEALVAFGVEKDNRCTVELTVRSGGTLFRAEESTTGDMRAAIDASVATIERQIRKNKTRLAKRLRQDAFPATPTGPAAPAAEEEEAYVVVRTKRFPLKPMTVEEAILQMNLVGHTFFAFRNQEADGAFAVVYARHDGGYGLLEDVE